MQMESSPFLFRIKSLFCLLIAACGANSAVAAPEPNSVLKLQQTVMEKPLGPVKANRLFQDYCRATVPEHRRQLKEELLLRKNEILPLISGGLRGSRKDKISTIKLVKAAGWTEAEPDLIKLMSSAGEDEVVRVGACYALGELGARAAGSQLLGQLKAPSVQMRSASLLALGKLKDPNYTGNIEKTYLEDSNDLVKLYAEVALAKVGKLKGGPQIAIKLSKSSDLAVCFEAIRALGSIGGQDAIYRLKQIAKTHPLPGVRLAAEQAVKKAELVSMDRKQAVMYISEKVKDPDREIQIWAMNVAAKELGDEGQKILEEKAGESGKMGKTAAVRCLMYRQKKQAAKPLRVP